MSPPSPDPFADDYILGSKQKAEIQCSAGSISSEITLVEDQSFTPGTSLSISAQGIGLIRFSLPSSELDIPIYNANGTLAYMSTRAKRCSGNAVLSHPSCRDLVSTSYFFGPGREHVIEQLDSISSDADANKIKLIGKWTSRSVDFVMPNGNKFEWSYGKIKNADGEKVRLIVLRQKDCGDRKKGDIQGKVIAQLLRSELTRTPGTKGSSAGNGGKLVLDRGASDVLDESVIVATCLMMLKREIDRRRFMQMAAMAGAAGGGGS